MSNWLYQGKEFDVIPEGIQSFVYLITNLRDNRRYIGCKLFFFSRTKLVKGRRKRYQIESDWKTYWSSSESLKADVELLGECAFTREILYLCKSKSESKYLEAREQFDKRVLENVDSYYNRIVNCRINASHIKRLVVDNI